MFASQIGVLLRGEALCGAMRWARRVREGVRVGPFGEPWACAVGAEVGALLSGAAVRSRS
ncbi:hypothetical protein GCM10009646_87440 [Streptomyces aureus]